MEKQDVVMLKIFYAAAMVFFSALLVVSCGSSKDLLSNRNDLPEVEQSVRVVSTEHSLLNEEAPIPPQCYTKTEGKHNPCYVCHQRYEDRESVYRMNKLDDGGIQGGYLFSDIGVTNHWKNLFEDRTAWVDSISDNTIKTYVAQDNYSPLVENLRDIGWQGFIPDLENYHSAAEAFAENGIAKDGSGWVAFNYKPMPSTFWPTNGSTDDVLIRLPVEFQQKNGEYDEVIYQLNLAILEMAIKQLDSIEIATVDETEIEIDVDGDNMFSDAVSHIRSRTHYIGDAFESETIPQQFPVATEFMHSVRYVGVDADGGIAVPARMKELRYMKKIKTLTESELKSRFDRERKEKILEELPSYVDHGDEGFTNGLGWMVQGFIEDYDGALRPQSFEEQMFCMGCHSAIGSTIDSNFSFARKVTGKAGWQYIDLRGMRDAPSATQTEGEILQYLKASGGGNEFRENPEMFSRWFYEDGTVRSSLVKNSDVYTLITPSPERALTLNKAYTHIVRNQSYIYGRDATVAPVQNVHETIDESLAPLEPEHRIFGWDIQLNWD